VSSAVVAPGFFYTLRIPMLEGRDFTERDNRDRAQVVIVNQTFAQRYFGGHSPVGRRVLVDGTRSTVAGLVKDSKYYRLTEPPTPYIYLPYRQWHSSEFWTGFFIRTVGPARGSFAAVRREAAAINPNAGVAEVVQFEEMVAGSLYAQKVAALLSVLGAVSLHLDMPTVTAGEPNPGCAVRLPVTTHYGYDGQQGDDRTYHTLTKTPLCPWRFRPSSGL